LQMPWIQVRLPMCDVAASNSLAWCETFKELQTGDTVISNCHIGANYANIALTVPYWHIIQINEKTICPLIN